MPISGTADSSLDPFHTREIRRRVLSAWAASAARFREDANAEEDYALGGYRDRLVVELAQNAADAALAAGRTGRLRITVTERELLAANVGAPLDAAGVEALATLRASAKRDGTTAGRYGVGFAAVLAVTDAPSICSGTGGVRFSAAATREEVQALPGLTEELRRRDGRVPVLRLPWPDDAAADAVMDGFDTVVRLPLLPGAAEFVRRLLDDVDATLLLGLPALEEIEIDGRVLRREIGGPDVTIVDAGRRTRWRVQTAAGSVPAILAAGRPVEERVTTWQLSWAVPLGDDGEPLPPPGAGVLHAPTPSDESISLPARLVATYPLDPDRRHVAPGPLADYLTEQAASAYADLVVGLPPVPSVLALVPRPTLAAAPLDAALTRSALAALRRADLMPLAAPDPPKRVRPDRAVVVDAAPPALVRALADVVDGLLPAMWCGRELADRLDPLGVRRLSVPDVVDLVSTVDRSPSWWHDLYAALAGTAALAELAGLPVPLADGGLVRDVAGVLLPADGLAAGVLQPAGGVAVDLGALGVRMAHPDCVHPLLERLGARPATARSLLSDDRVRAAVATSYDAEDPAPIAAAALALVAAAGTDAREHPYLADLALPGEDGEWSPAGEMLLPGGALAAVVSADSPFGRPDPAFVERHGNAVLAAIGVLDGFATVHRADVALEEIDDDLDDVAAWCDAVYDRLPPNDEPPIVAEFVAVRDLELVRDDAWPEALAMIAAGEVRDAVDRPAAVVLGGRRHDVPSYTRWWLATHPVIDGRRPDRLRTPGTDDLAGLYDVAEVDAGIAELVGVLRGLDDVVADVDAAIDLLARLGDPRRGVSELVLVDVYARLAAGLDGVDVDPPARLRVGPTRVVDRSAAVVVDAPYLLPLVDGSAVPAGGSADAVAALLGVPLASACVRASGAVVALDPGTPRAWADLPGAFRAAARCGAVPPSASVVVQAGLTVDGVPVPWWPDGELDRVDADAGPDVLGRALAWRLGRWSMRAGCAEALAAPQDARLAAEDAIG